MKRRFDPSGPLRGSVRAAADKSLSHRAALLAAMTSDPVRVTGYLDAADTNSTLAAVEALGALVERGEDHMTIRGTGLRAAAPAVGLVADEWLAAVAASPLARTPPVLRLFGELL